MCPSLRLRIARGFGPPVIVVEWYWVEAKMAEAPTVEIVKKHEWRGKEGQFWF